MDTLVLYPGWISKRVKVIPMGVSNFGQSGDLKGAYELNEIDLNSIIDRYKVYIKINKCGCGEIGRHTRFRFWWKIRGGSSPPAAP